MTAGEDDRVDQVGAELDPLQRRAPDDRQRHRRRRRTRRTTSSRCGVGEGQRRAGRSRSVCWRKKPGLPANQPVPPPAPPKASAKPTAQYDDRGDRRSWRSPWRRRADVLHAARSPPRGSRKPACMSITRIAAMNTHRCRCLDLESDRDGLARRRSGSMPGSPFCFACFDRTAAPHVLACAAPRLS